MTRREILFLPVAAAAAQTRRQYEEVRRFSAPEATQGVAADDRFLYAIGNHVIGKYEKDSGKRIATWNCEKGKALIHLDSGVVHDGVLYCAHSNYPDTPMVSSIEMWNANTLQHSGSYSFGIFAGSATWVDFRDGFRYVTFAHYRGAGDEPSRDPRWTTLVQFDPEWRQRQGWVYPAEVVSRLGDMAISGGVFAADGRLWCTAHDNPEIYVLRFPDGGSTLVLDRIIPTTIKGQGIALDPADTAVVYGIDRAKREIIVARISVAN
jgi:hypothetical protein